MNGYVLLPSKESLQRDAMKIGFLRSNTNAKLVIAEEHLREAVSFHWRGDFEVTTHATGLVLVLDKDGQHCGTYRL